MAGQLVDPTTPRLVPELHEANRDFWTGGADGELRIMRDERTGRWVSPTEGVIDEQIGHLVPRAVSGRGTVFTFTINTHRYHPDVEPPYVIAIVQLEEQDDLRLPTNIVGCRPEEVSIGMAVEVAFERQDDVFVPVFAPAR